MPVRMPASSVPFRASLLAAGVAMAIVPGIASAMQPAAARSADGPFTTAAAATLPKAAAAPSVSISPSVLDFGSVVVGTTGGPGTVNFSFSTGYVLNGFDVNPPPLCYGGGVYGGPFSYTSDCSFGSPANAPGVCHFTATYTPSFYYTTDSLTIYACDNTGLTNGFTLDGTGVPPPPLVLSPSSWNFGTVLLGNKTASRNFILFNPGPFTIDIGTPVSTAPDFVLTSSSCTSTIGPSERCNIGVSFAPQGTGLRAGQLYIPGLLLGRGKVLLIDVFLPPPLVTADLSGTGSVQADLGTPSALDFGNLVIGSGPQSLPAEITNNGNGTLTFSSISVSDPFTLVNGCPPNLSPGQSCSLTVGFDPVALGPFEGALTIQSNDQAGTQSIPVNARVVPPGIPVLDVTPTIIGFGDRMAGTMTAAQRVTVTNIGGVNATLQPLTVDLEYRIVANTCGATLAVGASCSADVAFFPLGFGPRGGTLTVNGNDAQSPHDVKLNGTGCRPFMIGRAGGDSCAP